MVTQNKSTTEKKVHDCEDCLNLLAENIMNILMKYYHQNDIPMNTSICATELALWQLKKNREQAAGM